MRRLLRWYGVSTALVVCYYGLLLLEGLEPNDPFLSTLRVAAAISFVFGSSYLIGLFYWTAATKARSAGALARAFLAALRRPEVLERLVSMPLLILLSTTLFDAFSSWKRAIGRFQPYKWDPLLADWDRVLHVGFDPWRFTHALLGWATPLIDWWYVWAWWAVKVVLLYAIFTWDDLRRRARFLLSHLLVWSVAGTALAILFASGGPMYYGAFTGDGERFGALFSALGSASPNAQGIKTLLWEVYTGQVEASPVGGISAMPSLHVGASTLAAAWGWDVGRWPGLALTLWAVLTFVSSVHLGWHYAIDGYVGALTAVGCWWLAGRVIGNHALRDQGEADVSARSVSQEEGRRAVEQALG